MSILEPKQVIVRHGNIRCSVTTSEVHGRFYIYKLANTSIHNTHGIDVYIGPYECACGGSDEW